MDRVRREADRFPILSHLEKITNKRLRKEYTLLLLGAFLFVVTMVTPVGALLSSALGLIVPLKETLVVLRQVKRKDEEVKHLLIFWMVFSFVTALDAYSNWAVRLVPFYHVFKFAFLFWLGPQRFRGSEFIYDHIISKIPEAYYVLDSPSRAMDAAAKKASEVVKKTSIEKQSLERQSMERSVVDPVKDK